jgi:Family of unknown function (DUF5719)
MTGRLVGAARVAGVLVVGAGLVVGAAQVPTSALDLSPGAPAPAASTRPVSAAQLVCPGPETLTDGSDEKAPAPAFLGVVTAAPGGSSAQGPSASTVPVPGGKPLQLFRSPATSGSLGTAASVEVTASGPAAAGMVANQVTVVASGDLRGLSGTACAAPTTDTWLVGGGGEDGRRGRIVLTNAAPNAVDVSLHVLSADGRVEGSASGSVTVPARSRATVLLGALAPSVRSPVVHVTTSRGAVTATLHDARLHGTTAWGTDDVSAGAPPSRSVLVPGLLVDGAALVRIAVPGPDEAVAQVRLLGADGEVVAPENGVVRVPAGSARDLDLSALPPGAYGIEVTADVPVVAGAMVERRTDPAGVADLAWLASAPPLTGGEHLVGVAGVTAGRSDLTATLALTAPADAATAQLTSGTSAPTEVRVPAGTTKVVTIPADQATVVHAAEGSGPVVVARLLTAPTPQGALITGSSLVPAPVVQHLTPVAPAS